jgi:SanA protein
MKLLRYSIIICIVTVIFILIINLIVFWKSDKYIYTNVKEVPECYTAIVLGAFVSKSGYLSDILQDRVDMAIELYKNKKIKRFLLSGDHGRVEYDEVNSMKKYLTDNGIDTQDIFLDHAGFDTYNSMVRANRIFQVKDAIVVSQGFHLPRAIYIARSKGIKAYGIEADKRQYVSINKSRFREVIANIKAFYEVSINKSPRFMGNEIPITGDSKLSYD